MDKLLNIEKLSMKSVDLTQANIDKIAQLFPSVITEVRDENGRVIKAVDFDLLKQELSDEIVDGDKERYQLTWPGKKEAILHANTPIDKTLRPVMEDSIDWDNTQNLYIEGDNLEVLKLLQESYLNKVKCIYIDPPYNTGKDFIYKDDFRQTTVEYLAESGQVDDEGNRLFQNNESNGRFHSDWLTMMYSRLKLARNLLRDDGVIFVSIDDNEVANLKKICNELFGEKNFVGLLTVINNLKGRNDRKHIAICHEYLLIYGKGDFITRGLPLTEEQKNAFNKIDDKGNKYQLRDLRKRGRPDRREDRPNMYFPIYYNESTKECSIEKKEGWIEILPLRGDGSDGRWRWGKERVIANLSILEPKYSSIAQRWGIEHRVYLNPAVTAISDETDIEEDDERRSKSKSFWMGGELSTDVGRRQYKDIMYDAEFDYPKPIDFLNKVIYMGSTNDDIILDFFSGSATTAHAIMNLNAEDSGNRKFIMVQLPEHAEKSEVHKAGYKNICEIGKERIRRAAKKIKEETNADIDYGFRVFRVDSSNMKDVFYSPNELEQSLFKNLESNIKEDRSNEDLLIQVMLDCGLELSLPMETREIHGRKIHCVAGNSLIACFDEIVPEEAIKEIAKEQPLRVVFRDSSFASDADRINVEEIFKMLSPGTEIKVI